MGIAPPLAAFEVEVERDDQQDDQGRGTEDAEHGAQVDGHEDRKSRRTSVPYMNACLAAL